MNQEQQTVGDVIERTRLIHEEAHRRAVARNQDAADPYAAMPETLLIKGPTERLDALNGVEAILNFTNGDRK
jgi:hypothetical protein